MGFQSILGVGKSKEMKPEDIVMPDYFYDLNLNQIVNDIMDHQKLYDLRRYFYLKAEDENIKYRQDIMKDMENDTVFQSVIDFAIGLRKAKEYLGNISMTEHSLQKQKWKLDAADLYTGSVHKFYHCLIQQKLTSQGMTGFREWLKNYIDSNEFSQLVKETKQLMSLFDKITFHITMKSGSIIIEPGILEDDYCKQIKEMFSEETQEEHYYQINPCSSVNLSALEKVILEVLQKSYTDTFLKLKEFHGRYEDFINPLLNEFEVESQFYVAFRLYRDELLTMNPDLQFCYPQFTKKEFHILDGYDLALARKNASKKKEVIFNDCYYKEGERFLVITGPNQGGKTTYARAVGQILYIGMIGLMAPAREAYLPAVDGIFTHFATEESMETGTGKLKEELIRLKSLMKHATRNSFIIINEIFTSAASYDAYIMGKKTIEYFMDTECQGIYVTHIHELTREDGRIVSMVASLLSEDSNIRTFKIRRSSADGRSYANTIVEKYHMTYDEIKERIRK